MLHPTHAVTHSILISHAFAVKPTEAGCALTSLQVCQLEAVELLPYAVFLLKAKMQMKGGKATEFMPF